MKIINLETFLDLPCGTIYSKYSPCIFDGLKIKHETLNDVDFVCQDIIGNIKSCDGKEFGDKCLLAENGISIELDFETIGRDGLFERDQLFAIYEKEDIRGLIGVLLKGF